MKRLAVLLILLILPGVLAQTDCPFGEVNCTGQCGGFIDTNNDGLCDLSVEEAVVLESPASSTEAVAGNSTAQLTPAQSQVRNYNLIALILISAILYGLTYFLVKMKKISMILHRKIWNIVLLVSFLISAILGLLLVIRINFGWAPTLPFSLLFWHVETGIVMTMIAIFHILWHWPYFKALFARRMKN